MLMSRRTFEGFAFARPPYSKTSSALLEVKRWPLIILRRLFQRTNHYNQRSAGVILDDFPRRVARAANARGHGPQIVGEIDKPGLRIRRLVGLVRPRLGGDDLDIGPRVSQIRDRPIRPPRAADDSRSARGVSLA